MEPPPQAEDSAPDARLHAATTLTLAGRALLFLGGALPWLLPLARRHLPLGTAGVTLDRLFVPMCHRLPERTLTLAGVSMPLCSRCAGVFAGVALGAALLRPRLTVAGWRRMIAVASLLMLLEVVTQDAGLHPIWHPTRVLSGMLFGYALAVTCLTALRGPQPARFSP